MDRKDRQIRLRFIILPALVLLVSCNQKTLSVFFDLPVPPPEKATKKATARQQAVKKIRQAGMTPLSVIKMENAESWEEAERLLPKNKQGQRDWVLALDKSFIQPRSAIGEVRKPRPIFKFDFYLKGPIRQLDAYFPHSTHTQHLECASCHPRIFRYRGTKITMAGIRDGKYCGFCHGTVSFSADNKANCVRCHRALAERGQ